jgi:hypothetical protein
MLFSPSFLSATPFSVTTQPASQYIPRRAVAMRGEEKLFEMIQTITPQLTDQLGRRHVETRVVHLLPLFPSLSDAFWGDSNDRQLAR